MDDSKSLVSNHWGSGSFSWSPELALPRHQRRDKLTVCSMLLLKNTCTSIVTGDIASRWGVICKMCKLVLLKHLALYGIWDSAQCTLAEFGKWACMTTHVVRDCMSSMLKQTHFTIHAFSSTDESIQGLNIPSLCSSCCVFCSLIYFRLSSCSHGRERRLA